MGMNNSTRRVSFESDENENITVVKGIRLSENVINRMREPAATPKRATVSPPSTASAPLPPPPLLQPVTSLPPPLPPVEPVSPAAPLGPPPPPPPGPSTETIAAPPPQPPKEQVAAPTVIDVVLPITSPAAAKAVTAPAFEPAEVPPPGPSLAAVELAPCPTPEPIASSSIPETISALPLPAKTEPITVRLDSEPISSAPIFESVSVPQPAQPSSGDTLSPQPAKLFAKTPLAEFTASYEPVAPPPQTPAEPVAPVPEPVVVPESSPVLPTPPVAPPVDKEALRKKITDELHKDLEKERTKAEQDLQSWLKSEKARASAQAQAAAQSQVKNKVSSILAVERAATQENLQQAIIRERITSEDERRRAQLFAKQLEATEADLHRREVFYRDQMARLEERSAQFYKVTTENYHKAADEVNAKYKRYEVYPVCADLQGQILTCYRENVGRTLQCSNIAALYLQCVNKAKQDKLKTGR